MCFIGKLWVSTCCASFDSNFVVLEVAGCCCKGDGWSEAPVHCLMTLPSSRERVFLSLHINCCCGVIRTDIGPGWLRDQFGSHSFLLDLDSPGPSSSQKPFLQLDKMIPRFPQDRVGSSSVSILNSCSRIYVSQALIRVGCGAAGIRRTLGYATLL